MSALDTSGACESSFSSYLLEESMLLGFHTHSMGMGKRMREQTRRAQFGLYSGSSMLIHSYQIFMCLSSFAGSPEWLSLPQHPQRPLSRCPSRRQSATSLPGVDLGQAGRSRSKWLDGR